MTELIHGQYPASHKKRKQTKVMPLFNFFFRTLMMYDFSTATSYFFFACLPALLFHSKPPEPECLLVPPLVETGLLIEEPFSQGLVR